MRWHEITIHTTEEAIEMITNFLHEMGAGGVSIEESGTLNKPRDTSLGQWYELPLNDIPEGEAVIKGYFTEGIDPAAIMRELADSIGRLRQYDIDPGRAEITEKIVDEEDWANAWKQYFKPLRISERLTIKPSWESYEAGEDELVLELDPGMAFGTGTHPTTALCLRTLERVVRPGDEGIDVGTGSGVLSIGACKLGASRMLALDLDPVAVSSATENVKLNGLQDRIAVRQSDLLQALRESGLQAVGQTVRPDGDNAGTSYGHLANAPAESGVGSEALKTNSGPGVSMPVRFVVANILAEIILLFIQDVYDVLQPGGTYVASGIIRNKEDEVVRALEAAGFTVSERFEEQDWVALTAVKP